ncbi:PBP1A family penicillin-binding protein [Candidatus Woesebacteria bacterium]|nr:MAG: PBP1A family penicillin-binding protein [Candidatus Woesebacteria bacterium]
MAKWKKVYRRKRKYERLARRQLADKSNIRSLVSSKWLVRIAKFGFVSVILGFLAIFVLIPLFAFNLPSPDKIIRREGFSTKILARDGQVLYDIYVDQNRTHVNLEDIPDYLKQATVAIEDKNFYHHQGFDIFGMARGVTRIFTRGRAQGGSTLTQQLVKNALLSPERSVFRKIKEFILAIQIERAYSKDEILTLYLNEVPYGGTAWGVQAAAQAYFGKDAKELSLTESAILAGLPQRPSLYSPYSSSPDAYIGRTQDVLRRMREDGYITKEQEEEVKEQLGDIEFQPRGASFKAPHFVQYVQEILEERYGQSAVEQGGLKVTTTLDIDLQEKAQTIVTEEIEKVESQNIGNGAAVVLDPQTGEILVMVGSKDFAAADYDGQVNVTTRLRQPGSAIKPITYATALEKGYTASTMLMDVPTEFPGGEGQPPYIPVNYDGEYRGPIQLRYALANSINVPAVKLLALVGINDVLDTAYKLGISSFEPNKETLSRVGLSLTLGGGEVKLLELTGAYSAFMNKGFAVEPVAILKVEDGDGNILEENKPEKGKQVISEEVAYIISHILSDNQSREAVFGSNSLLNISGRQVAVKTGTTNDKRDNWAIGGTPGALTGVWVGNNDNSQMKNVASGVSGATPIWRRIILEALSQRPAQGFEVPDGVVTKSVDSVSGYASHDGYSSRIEYFVKGTEPGDDPVHTKLKVCKTDGKLASPSDISSGNYEEKEFFVFKEEDPTSAPGGINKWQEGILTWIQTQEDARYKPPTDYCQSGSPVGVSFDNPQDQTSNHPNALQVKIKAESTNNLTEVAVYVDGTKEKTFTQAPYTLTLNLQDGKHELKAVVRDEKGNQGDRVVRIGVNTTWDYQTPTPSPTSAPSITPD